MHCCEDCSKSFSRNSSLLRHLTSNAHKNRTNNNMKYYLCVCGKKYSYSQTLYTHKKRCSVINQQNEITELHTQINKLKDRLWIVDTERKKLQKTVNIIMAEKDSSKVNHANDDIPIRRICKRESMSSDMRHQIKNRQNDACGICKKGITTIFQIDHIIALQYGGTNNIDNLMALCCECHAEKSHKELKCRDKIRSAITEILNSYYLEEISR